MVWSMNVALIDQYMLKTMRDPESLWTMRKQFASQTATLIFLTYFACLTNRAPNRFHLSRTTGKMHMTEILLGESLKRTLMLKVLG